MGNKHEGDIHAGFGNDLRRFFFDRDRCCPLIEYYKIPFKIGRDYRYGRKACD